MINKVPVVAISIAAHRDVEVHQVISVVGCGLPDVVLDASAPEHHAAAAPVDGVLGGDHPDVDSPLLPQPVVRHHVLNLVQALAELGDELVDVVQKTDRDVLGNRK